MTSMRTLTHECKQNDFIVHQMDVKAAYLNVPIDCEIFVEQPEDYEEKGVNGEKLYGKLNKSLYGLKQRGKNWNQTLHDHLTVQGFTPSINDPYVDTRNSNGILTIILHG